MRISILGLKNIPLAEEAEIEANVDYLLPVVVCRESVETWDSHGEENEDRTIKVKVVRIADIQKIGTHEVVKVVKGKTPAQRMRAAIFEMLQRTGEEPTEENYEKKMDGIMRYINEINP